GFGVSQGGIHKQVRLINQSDVNISPGSGALYANIVNGQTWPLWKNALGGTLMLGGPTTGAQNGSTSLSGGIVLKWGIQSIPNTSHATGSISFPSNFLNNCFVVNVSLVSRVGGTSSSDDTIAVRQGSFGTSGFTWDFNGTTGNYTFFTWIA